MSLRRIGLIPGPLFLAAFLLLISGFLISPQNAHAATAASPGVMNGTIGDAVLVLSGPWRFEPGDDLAWARPEFDD